MIPLSSLSTPTPTTISFVPYDSPLTTITIKQSIPYETLFAAIQDTLLLITDGNGYISAPIKQISADICLTAAYTDISFPFLKDPNPSQQTLFEAYDIITKSGVLAFLKQSISPDELSFFTTTLNETVTSILSYRNSAAGVIELISAQNENLTSSLTSSLDTLSDERTQEILKALISTQKQ